VERTCTPRTVSGVWKWTETLYADDVHDAMQGDAVSLNYQGTVALVGGYLYDSLNLRSSGAAFVFKKDLVSQKYVYVKMLTSTSTIGLGLSMAVDAAGTTALITGMFNSETIFRDI
jgi:hypothetical protein